MEGNKEHFLLLLDHDSKLSLLTMHVCGHFIVFVSSLGSLQVLRFLFEFANSDDVAFDFVINNLHCGVSDLVVGEELVELCEIGIGLKYVQQVQSQVNALLIVVSQGS